LARRRSLLLMIVELMLAARMPRILAPLEHAEASGIAPARHIAQFEGQRQLVGLGPAGSGRQGEVRWEFI
jgi:hypothetical protein